MANSKKSTQKESSASFSFASQAGECESYWYLNGPPFDQRDYMISPSESASISICEKDSSTVNKKKFGPSDIKIDSKYLLDSQKALKKLSDLIKGGCAEHLVGRLEDLIEIFLQGSPMGFLLDDLSLVIEIVEFFSRNQSSASKFTEFVKTIMNFGREPPKVEKASDVLHFKEAMTDYFTLFGELLASFEDECFQLRLLEALDCLIIRQKLVHVCCVKLSFCHEAMEKSQLPLIVASLLETVPTSLYLHYLELALQIIWVSVRAGCVMVQSNVIGFALRRLDPLSSDKSENITMEFLEKEDELYDYYKLLDKSAYLIWGLFIIASKHNIQIPVPDKQAFWSLKYVFHREVRKKSQKAIETRNNLAGILAKLCAVFGGQIPLKETGLAGDMAEIAVATEIKIRTLWLEDINLGFNKKDYTLKKIMLLNCCLFAKSDDLVVILKDKKVIEGILLLISQKSTHPWIPSQYLNLLCIGLRTLSELVPKLPETYLAHKGNIRLLSTIKWLMEKHFDQDSFFEVLKTFCTIISCDNKSIIEDAKAKEGVKIILDACFCLLDVSFMKLEHQEKLSRVFLILEIFFKNDVEIQTTFGDSCVLISIKFLQRILADSAYDSKWISNLIVSFGGFLWEAVAWCSSSLKSFIEKGGVFFLLDFIESSFYPLQMFFLSILVDMTDEGETVAHLLTWRGKNGNGILSMMIDVWRKEEYLNKVHRTKDGVILDVEVPLMTEEQWYLTHQVMGAHVYSASIAEMAYSARPKVHALYQFLQRRYFELTQIGESTYCLQIKMIKPSYQVYIPLIEHFLALKMGEIWFEVIRDAEISGVLPTAFDGEVICTLIDEKNKWASRIKTIQEEILVIHQQRDAGEEQKLYNLLKLSCLPSALEAFRELDLIARASFQKFQKQKKYKQINTLLKSLDTVPFSKKDIINRTFLFNINTTKKTVEWQLMICSELSSLIGFCRSNRITILRDSNEKLYAEKMFLDFETVLVKSEKEATLGEDLVLVSPESSNDNHFDYTDEF